MNVTRALLNSFITRAADETAQDAAPYVEAVADADCVLVGTYTNGGPDYCCPATALGRKRHGPDFQTPGDAPTREEATALERFALAFDGIVADYGRPFTSILLIDAEAAR